MSRTFRITGPASKEREIESLLEAEGFVFEPEPFCRRARALIREPFPLGESLAARFGYIYIQDRSSMLPPLALAPRPGDHVLDVCASPGSKTSMLGEMVGPTGFVMGNEPSRDRLATLRANLRRLGILHSVTVSMPGQNLPLTRPRFKSILLDPPCSGWGTIERHPKAAELWSGDKTEPLIRLQRDLLAHCTGLLAPGGTMVYSTCTTNPMENEEQVIYAREELGLVSIPLEPPPGFVFEEATSPGMEGSLRVIGSAEEGGGRGQGFFITLFRKPGSESEEAPSPAPDMPAGKKKRRKKPGKKDRDTGLPGKQLTPRKLECNADVRFNQLPDGELYDFNGRVFFLPAPAMEMLSRDVSWQGTPVGRVKNNRFRPDTNARIMMPDFTEGGTVPSDTACANAEKAGHIVMDSPAPLRDLLAGRNVTVPSGPSTAGLYFGTIPLGWASRKGSRIILSGA